MAHDLPRILITTGEPSGVGIEVTLKALRSKHLAKIAVLGDSPWIEEINTKGKLGLTIEKIDHIDEARAHEPGLVQVLHHSLSHPASLGVIDVENSSYVIELLSQAHQLAFNHQVDAIVTAPVHKGVINDAGIHFTGHTEFLADHCGVERVVMMLASEPMNVALATTHLPLKDVAQSLNIKRLQQIFSICANSLYQQGVPKPKIQVLGLNPHAGENGHLGREELDIIRPAIETFEHPKVKIMGPIPADTAFTKNNLNSTDLFLAMFHDQGLPVIKYASFGECANVTLGLPYIRTSVDHGTALDIANQFCASESSMKYALTYAIKNATQSRLKTNS
ncbi:4-hydroxythreonine-4-phosphate dehydrogenase PdxA [Pleionea sediminis]|uniref:4-hydroxythreonine-4-phosphate dehydrogenase PdxA n=1 Tax=Pleionea sediminis TaxID=2569479 RepID=UPI00118632C1|nr:4-hydroxythreonine-4-phosphate dehydrogenase PdxA [Pleionea sediminis]